MVFYFLINKCIWISSARWNGAVWPKSMFYSSFCAVVSLVFYFADWTKNQMASAWIINGLWLYFAWNEFLGNSSVTLFPIGRGKSLVRCFIWILKFCQSHFISAKWIFIVSMDMGSDTVFPFCAKHFAQQKIIKKNTIDRLIAQES